MNNKWLVSFITVAQAGSVTAAAAELFISPQALLQQMNLLEEEVGSKLLLRDKKGIRLTVSGKEFLTGAKQMLEIYEHTLMRCGLASRAETTVRIPASNNVVVPKLMERTSAEFTRQTGITVEFVPDDHYEQWFEDFMNLRYDIIEHHTVDGLCPKGIHFEHLSDVQTCYIMSEYHPLARRKSILPEDLEGCRIMVQKNAGNLTAYIKLYLDSVGINIQLDYVENDRFAVIDGMNNFAIYSGTEEIAQGFPGYVGVPLDFDTHVQHGFVCREEMYETYKPFFQIARSVNEELKTKKI